MKLHPLRELCVFAVKFSFFKRKGHKGTKENVQFVHVDSTEYAVFGGKHRKFRKMVQNCSFPLGKNSLDSPFVVCNDCETAGFLFVEAGNFKPTYRN